MLLAALSRRGEGRLVSDEVAEAAIAGRVGITDEQAEAVRAALGTDGVVILQGPPGAGKSFMSEPIAAAARDAGKSVFVVSTSWRATDVIRDETNTPETAAKCMAAFLARLDPHHRDHIALDRDTMVIVDEGSMVDLASMADLLKRTNGARVIVIGDIRQLSAVGAGAPMEALASMLGTQRLQTIRRQNEEWQRAASTAFSNGSHADAFRSYDDHGFVHWTDGREVAFDWLVADWQADLVANSDGERLCMAHRHADVREINARCRSAYRAAGHLTGPDVELRAVGRGRRAVPEAIRLAAGDRVIFGESLEIGDINPEFGHRHGRSH